MADDYCEYHGLSLLFYCLGITRRVVFCEWLQNSMGGRHSQCNDFLYSTFLRSAFFVIISVCVCVCVCVSVNNVWLRCFVVVFTIEAHLMNLQ